MDIEDLSKSQLLLLTILVNFVVSIATGILTVSLLDQAPQTVTQTVDRIVDHTIETVTTQVPSIGKPTSPSSEDLLTSAVAAVSARTVSVSYMAGATTPTVTGMYLPKEGVVIAAADLPDHVTVTFSTGASVQGTKTGEEGSLKKFTLASSAEIPSLPSDTFADVSKLKPGQTAIGVTADGKAVTGIVSRIGTASLDADLPALPPGAALVNLSGAIIGVALPEGGFALPGRVQAFAASQ